METVLSVLSYSDVTKWSSPSKHRIRRVGVCSSNPVSFVKELPRLSSDILSRVSPLWTLAHFVV